MVIRARQTDVRLQLKIGGGSPEHGREATQFKWLLKSPNIVLRSPWGLEGHFGKYHTLWEMKDKFSNWRRLFYQPFGFSGGTGMRSTKWRRPAYKGMPDVAGVGICQTKVVKYTASLMKYASWYFDTHMIESKCRKTDQIYQYKGLISLKTSLNH